MGNEETDVGLEINEFNEHDEFCLKSYESSAIYKEKMKKYNDQRIENREFAVGDLVLLLISRLCLFSGKHKYKWTGIFLIIKVFHIERLSWILRKAQSSQSTGK